MVRESLSGLGARLAEAWTDASMIDAPATDELPANRTEAYFVQDAMATALGQEICGWKVGATSAKMRELDGHDDVIPGRIFRSVAWHGARLELPIKRFSAARVETEFAFQLSMDLPDRGTLWLAEEIAPHAVLHPAIEIIGNRYALSEASASTRSLMTIADNGGGIGFVFGDPVTEWQAVDFQQHHISLVVDDGEPAENFLGDMRCVPLQAVADLANHLNSRGIALSAGDYVSTGAATVPQPIPSGSRVIADFGEIGQIELTFVND